MVLVLLYVMYILCEIDRMSYIWCGVGAIWHLSGVGAAICHVYTV